MLITVFRRDPSGPPSQRRHDVDDRTSEDDGDDAGDSSAAANFCIGDDGLISHGNQTRPVRAKAIGSKPISGRTYAMHIFGKNLTHSRSRSLSLSRRVSLYLAGGPRGVELVVHEKGGEVKKHEAGRQTKGPARPGPTRQ